MLTVPIVGGNWNNSADAGVFARNVNNFRSNSNTNIGFRAADHGPRLTVQTGHTGAMGTAASRRRISSANSAGRCIPVAGSANVYMPKRHGGLYATCTSEAALWRAYYRARQGKRGTRAVMAFERDLGANIATLARELAEGDYHPRPLRAFQVTTPKPRVIHAPDFRDRIVQHAVYEMVFPLFDRVFIDQAYACRPGRGTHAAADQAQRYLRQAPADSYVLQIDIRKFFYRIDRDILRDLIERKIKDRRLVELMMLFAQGPDATGCPIGNLLSQLFAMIYLDALDRHAKRDLKLRRYVRYVDDMVIFGLNRDEARATLDHLRDWLWRELRLELSKWSIQPVGRGVNFVGYRTWRRGRFVRRHALRAFARRLHRGDEVAVRSLLAHAERTASRRHMAARVRDARPDIHDRLPGRLQCR